MSVRGPPPASGALPGQVAASPLPSPSTRWHVRPSPSLPLTHLRPVRPGGCILAMPIPPFRLFPLLLPPFFLDPPAAAALRTRNEMWAKMQRTIRTRAKLDDDDDPGWEMKIRPLALVAPFQFQSAGFAEGGRLEG